MKPIDYLKAVGVALAVLVLNLLLTTLVVTAYALLIAPGQPQDHYAAMAPKIGAWTGPAGGAALMFLARWTLARRRPDRNALAFAGVTWGIYLALDAGVGLAVAPPAEVLKPLFFASLAGAGIAALAGAALGRRKA